MIRPKNNRDEENNRDNEERALKIKMSVTFFVIMLAPVYMFLEDVLVHRKMTARLEQENLYLMADIGVVLGIMGFMAAIVGFLIVKKEYYQKKKAVLLLEDAVGSIPNGFIYFDETETLQKTNDRAAELIPELRDEGSDGDALLTASDFSMFLIKHCHDPAGIPGILTGTERKGFAFLKNFRGSIEHNRKVCLIDVQKTRTGGLTIILTDVTEIKKREEYVFQLNRQNHELIQAVEATSHGIVISNPKLPDNPVVFANKAFLNTLDLAQKDVLNHNWEHVLKAEENIEDVSLLLVAMENKKPATLEWRVDTGETPRWYEMTVSPVYDESGNLDLFIGLLHDETEIQIQKNRFYQAQKLEALGQLAGGVAHDFNNLLSIVEGYTRMALKAVNDDDPVKNHLERIKQATHRGASLTKQLLTFGRHKIVAESVTDLGNLVKEQENLLRPLLDGSVNMMLNAEENILVKCAEDGLAQILLNLVINARDSMPKGGTVIVDIRLCEGAKLPEIIPEKDRENKFACLSVTDTGSGMDQETVGRIFDPFFTTKEQGKGTGLGLSMVYGIINQMEGYIDVHSVKGEGTSMRLYLPVSKDGVPKAVVETTDNEAGIRFDGYTSLVAEDEKDLLHVVSSMLEDLGMNVIPASNGNEALMKQDEYDGEIDFLLTDVVMPEMNGMKLAELLHVVRPETKILFMSGYPANGQMARIQLPDEITLLAKPVEFDRLGHILKMQLEADSGKGGKKEKTINHWQTEEDNESRGRING